MHFSKISGRPQAKLNTTHENLRIFMFNPLPLSMQYKSSICDFVFRTSITQYSCFYFIIFLSYRVLYPGRNFFHSISYLAFETNSFRKKIQPPKPELRQTVNDLIRIQKIHRLWYHRSILLLFSILFHLFNKT